MFCPTCGTSAARPDQRFCKSCGTDLGLVSSALANRDTDGQDQSQPVQTVDLATINNQIARGYNDIIKGGGILLAIFVVVVLLHDRGIALWIVLWLLIWGSSSLAKGIGNVLAARHTTNNLASQTSQTLPPQPRTTAPVQTSPLPYHPPVAQTDPSNFHQPGSVTEQTTRKLENPESSAAEH